MDTQQNRKNEWPRLVRNFIMTAALLLAALPAKAADYVFEYGGGYLAVNDNGNVTYTTDFSRSCVWTCVSNTTSLTAATLGTTTSYYLYTEVNGKRYWLVGGTDDGQAITVTETSPSASWRNSDNHLVYYSSRSYYAYYRGGSWKTSRRNNGSRYGESAYMSGNDSGTDYRSTTYTVTTNNVTEALTGSLSTPTITPSAAQTLEYGGNVSYTASATGPTKLTPAHTTYAFNGETYYYYDGQIYNSNDAFATMNPTVTYSWELSGAGASALTLSPASGNTTTVAYTSSASGTTATLTVTAAVGSYNRSASVTINVTPVEPTGISAAGITMYASDGGTVDYTLTPDYGYDRVNATSSNTGVFTVSSPVTGGHVTITPAAAGTATLTLTALRSNGSNGPSTSVTVTVRDICATPEISISPSGSTLLATITCATPGATIYYTTNGSEPTTSSATYTAPIAVTDGQTIKAIAVKAGAWDNSAVITKKVTPIDYVVPGVSGGTVTINDLEDHTWTYYAGVDAGIDGGNYNTNYLGKLYSPNPRNVRIVYQANGGAVSIDEGETEFIYYKTLEQGATTGQYPYTVISNPFSKRPNGKGFGGWRIKEGADYINGYADEAVLPLDADIVIANLPYPTVNCLSAEIVLEATWVNLNNITYANNNTITYNVSGGNYETNILVLNRNVTGTITTTSPVTIMMVEPDGSSDYRGTYTFTGNITPNNNGVTKIEFTRWNSTNTLNCNNHSVTVGRGMTTTSQCASYVVGVNYRTGYTTPTYNANLNYHLKLESGIFTDVSFIAGIDGNEGYVNCNGTSNQVKGTLGNDYDRAKGDNTKLAVTDELFLGYRPTYASGNQNNANFTCWVKSGNMGSSTNVTNTTFNYNDEPNGGYYGDAGQTFYVSVGGTQTNIGKRKLYVEGGILAGIAGGIDANNPAGEESFFVRMTGGQVRGIVYGSGAFAASSGIRRFVITGGTINGWVAAGCNGTDPTQSGGTLPSDTYVYIGGTSHIGNTTDLTLNTSSDGNVFGAGSGNSAQATTGQVNNSNVVIADQCYVKKNVYGGGNYGYSNAIATVYVTGGQVANSVFGGSNQKQGVTVNVNMTGGKVDNGVYGGSNASGTISGNVTMTVNGGTVGDGTDGDGVFGGGYGASTIVTGNVSVTLGASTTATDSATVNGNVYGGSALGRTNNGSATNTTTVTMNKALVNGNLFGGAYGNGANVNGRITVNVNGGRVDGNVFGGGDAAAYNKAGQNYPVVNMTGGQATNVFGGGKGSTAVVTGNPQVTLSGTAHVTGNVYGGGDAAEVSGQTNVILRD